MPEGNSSFQDILLFVRRGEKDLRAFAETLSGQDFSGQLQKLRTAVEKIGSKPAKRPPLLDIYLAQWESFTAKQRSDLDRGAVRCLCWEPQIAVTQPFLEYIRGSQMELTSRSLQGLIYSSHNRWDDAFARSAIVAGVRKMLSAYEGLNRVINKWQSKDEAILGLNGPRILAEEFIKTNTSLKNYLEAWYLDSQSPFTRQMVLSATEECRARLAKLPEVKNTLFKELLPWLGWDITEFKAQISNLILDRNSNQIWNLLQPLILEHKELGDPRLPRNRQRWLGVSEAAIKRLLEILCRDDIVFFFDHVLPTDKDRQNRKQFWLQYLGRYTASRPLLGANDRIRLRPFLKEYRGGIQHFGEMTTYDNSAFLLDFGNIIVVEFSKIGACFIYDKRDFNKIIPDIWARTWFSEPMLRQGPYIKRIIHLHTVNIDWRDRARQVLAAQGIRPGNTL